MMTLPCDGVASPQGDPQLVALIAAFLSTQGGDSPAPWPALRLEEEKRPELGGRGGGDDAISRVRPQPTRSLCSRQVTSGSDDGNASQQTTSDSNQCSTTAGSQAAAPEKRMSLRREGEMWSKGSANHPHGCTPCAFFCFKRPGCADGADCLYCHMNHTSRTRTRRDDWKRQQREKHLERMAAASAQKRETGRAPPSPECLPLPSAFLQGIPTMPTSPPKTPQKARRPLQAARGGRT